MLKDAIRTVHHFNDEIFEPYAFTILALVFAFESEVNP